MGLQKFLKGSLYTVFLWEEGGDCPVLDYPDSLKSGGRPQVQDAATLARRLRELSEHGPPLLREHGHLLQNSDGIHELKAPNGARLFWFYEKGRVVVCSHGAHKPKSNSAYNPHIERAQRVRTALQAQHIEPATLKPVQNPKRKRKR